jgi:hypothetical protein
MTALTKTLLAAASGAGIVVFLAASASAAIVCSGRVCWHTTETLEYPRGARVIVHPDDWHWRPREHFTFREHEGRGYWTGGRWREF